MAKGGRKESPGHDLRERPARPRNVDLQPPVRSCAGCGVRQTQRAMLRVASQNGANPVVDAGFSAPGRGAYLCRRASCIETALKRHALERTLKLKQGLPSGISAELRQLVADGQPV